MNRKQLFLLQMASMLFASLTLSNLLTGSFFSLFSALALLVTVAMSVWGWRRMGAQEREMTPDQVALAAQAEHAYTPREKSWLKGFAIFAGLMLLLIIWIELGK